MFDYYNKQHIKKKALSIVKKKKIKTKKDAIKASYQYYLLNSRKQIINNFRIKLSKLFRNRNKYSKTNKVKIKV